MNEHWLLFTLAVTLGAIGLSLIFAMYRIALLDQHGDPEGDD